MTLNTEIQHRENTKFHPKILLFGEYSVILNSQALTIPYDFYEGELKLPKAVSHESSASNRELKNFFQFLSTSQPFKLYQEHFDWPKFQFELNQGLYFASNIPQGYGVGSSGALTAAVYHRYIDSDFSKKTTYLETQKVLATMESYYHGKSSGLDPLVSYLDQPILYRDSKVDFAQIPDSEEKGSFVIFLLDTGRARRTEALVNLYIEKLKNPLFAKACHDDLIPQTNHGIESFLENDIDKLFKAFYQISRFQYDHFLPMIPKNYHQKWTQGLEGSQTLLKLCGAGGGGYLLGMTRDFSHLASHWKDEQIHVLWRYKA